MYDQKASTLSVSVFPPHVERLCDSPRSHTLNRPAWDSRCLEEVDPPVRGAQVEHVGPLAVVRRLHGQRVVDGHGVLQVLVRQLLVRPVLPLQGRYKEEMKAVNATQGSQHLLKWLS